VVDSGTGVLATEDSDIEDCDRLSWLASSNASCVSAAAQLGAISKKGSAQSPPAESLDGEQTSKFDCSDGTKSGTRVIGRSVSALSEGSAELASSVSAARSLLDTLALVGDTARESGESPRTCSSTGVF